MGAGSVGAIIRQNKKPIGAHRPKGKAAVTFRIPTASRNYRILPISYVLPGSLGSVMHADELQL